VGALRIAVLALVAVLATAAPAAGATPRFLGTGHDPGVAVDRAGTAHVAWFNEPDGGQPVLEYCQVPRRARACTVRHTFALPEAGTAKAQVLAPRPGTVVIVAPLFQEPSLILTSADGGATFAAAPTAGVLPTIEQTVFGPGEAVSMISNTGPARFAAYALNGAGPAELTVSFADATESLDTGLARFGSGFAAFFSGLATRSAIWNGVGDPNLPQSWVEGPRLGDDRTAAAAAGGRAGTFVAYVDHRGSRSDTRVRKLRRNGRFGPAKRITREDPASLQMTQGPRGHMAVLWSFLDDAWIARSRNGRRWTRPKRLFRGNQPSDLRPALGRRGGWVVWDGSAGNLGSHPIRIAALPRGPRR
jgi:hypothetical protein